MPKLRIAGEQTERMAAAIFVSAFVFHAAIEGQPGIPPVPPTGSICKDAFLNSWNAILAINYWPVFSIARDLVREMPLRAVPPVMEHVAESLAALAGLGATSYHDLTGRMLQTLIADRKFLATFYTLPESAGLLAELAGGRLKQDWSDRATIENLRIADFACGNEALLSAAQRAVCRRYRRGNGDDKDLHRALMERVLTGLDIMPAATHLTCSMLSSAHPALAYGDSRIFTMPYGIDGGGTHIGALDLLDSEHAYSLFAAAVGGTESASHGQHSVTVRDGSCDLVIMNPPFTRPTNHESARAGIPVPSFAGFGTSSEEQQAMGRRLRKSGSLFGSGHAGLASNFMDLAHRKLKDGGALASVLPFAFARSRSWKRARQALRARYKDIQVTSIVASGSTARAFSTDTGMAECLVVATKGGGGETTYFNLAARPSSLLEAAAEAKNTGGPAVRGSILDAGPAGVRSASVIEAARSLAAGQLRLPRTTQAVELAVTTLGTIAKRGLVDRDISGGPTDRNKTGPPQGPFVVRRVRPGEVPTYPMLWTHSAERERRFVVPPDSCGDPRPGDEERALERWNRAASRLHASRDFRLNSQSLAMCLSEDACLGGRAWPTVLPARERYELLLWCNSTPGLLMHSWTGTRQQSGRSMITSTGLPGLPVLDPRTLTDGQLDRCRALFKDGMARNMRPANEAWRDESRKVLDRGLPFGPASVLGLDAGLEEGLDLLRRQWCAEPSVHGGNSTRIADRPVPFDGRSQPRHRRCRLEGRASRMRLPAPRPGWPDAGTEPRGRALRSEGRA